MDAKYMIAFRQLDGSWQWTKVEWTRAQVDVIRKQVKEDSLKIVEV